MAWNMVFKMFVCEYFVYAVHISIHRMHEINECLFQPSAIPTQTFLKGSYQLHQRMF